VLPADFASAAGLTRRMAGVDLVFPFFDCSAARARVVEDDLKFRVDGCCPEPFRAALFRTELFRVELPRLAADDFVVLACCCFAALERAELARLAAADLVLRACFCSAELERARVAADDRDWLAWERPVCLEAVCRAADFCGAALEDFEDLDCPTATP